MDLGGIKEPRIKWGTDPYRGGGNFWRMDISQPIVKYREYDMLLIFSTLFGRWQQQCSSQYYNILLN